MQCFDIFDEAVQTCLKMCSGYELVTNGTNTSSDSDAVIACFSSTKMAVKFCLMLQVKLLEADWPKELMPEPVTAVPIPLLGLNKETKDENAPLPGISCRMGISSGVLKTTDMDCFFDSKMNRYIYFGDAIKRATIIAGYVILCYLMVF